MEVREGFKHTEIGLFPQDWQIDTIGNNSTISSGTTPLRALYDRYYRNGTIHWTKTLDLNNSFIKDTEEKVTQTAINETSLRIYPEGSVIVAMYGGFGQIGRTGLLRVPSCVNQALSVIVPDLRRVNPEYLLRVLNFRVYHWRSVASSSRKDPNISGKDVRDFLLALPSVKEQEAIANALSDMDAYIESLEKLIAKKRLIKKGVMQELLTGKRRLEGFTDKWITKTLGSIAELYQPQTISAKEFTDSGYPVYGANGIVGFYNKANHTTWQVTVTCRGSTCGTVNRTVEECWITGNAMVINCENNKSIDKQFLYYKLLSTDLSDCITGTGQPQIVRAPLSAVLLKIPNDKNEQVEIGKVLTNIDEEILKNEMKLDKAHLLKQGMMQELLTGRIRLV